MIDAQPSPSAIEATDLQVPWFSFTLSSQSRITNASLLNKKVAQSLIEKCFNNYTYFTIIVDLTHMADLDLQVVVLLQESSLFPTQQVLAETEYHL